MTPEVEKKRRELFEVFVVDFHRGAPLYCERHSDPEYPALNGQLIYEDWNVQSAWAVFNAALDAVEIDLSALNDLRHHGEFRRGLTHAANQIEATGLGLRIK